MLCRRIVARLDVKGPNVVKGIHFEGLRIIGDPKQHAISYQKQGADEILYIDTVASLYGRNNLADIVRETAKEVFIPLTVGGGIRKIDDISELLNAGADKVAINTAAIRQPDFITAAANVFGSQCIVVSIEAKYRGNDHWEAYTENGRQPEGRDLGEWIQEAVARGAGEMLITSIDQDGTRKGLDTKLLKLVSTVCPLPYIFGGGVGNLEHVLEVFYQSPDLPALACASVLHFKQLTVNDMKAALQKQGIPIRLEA